MANIIRKHWKRDGASYLLLFWATGFLAGFFCIYLAYPQFAYLFQNAAGWDMSLFGLCTIILLPFLLTAAVAYSSHRVLFLVLAFGKAFCYAFCSFGVLWSYGSAGWLVRSLLLFSDSCIVFILLLLWLVCIGRKEPFQTSTLTTGILAAGFIVLVDYLYITPLLQSAVL